MRLFLPLLAAMAATPALAQPAPSQPVPASAPVATLFERDWVLMNWALKFYDRDRDILLSPAEVRAAAAEFRRIADGDGDGRVTPREYRAGRAFILARH